MRLLLQGRHALHARHSPACLCCCKGFQSSYAVRRRRTPARCAAWCCACCSSTPASTRGAPAWLQRCGYGMRLPMRLAGDHAPPWLIAPDCCWPHAISVHVKESLTRHSLALLCREHVIMQPTRRKYGAHAIKADCRRAAQGSESAHQAAHSAHTARRSRLWWRRRRRKS